MIPLKTIYQSNIPIKKEVLDIEKNMIDNHASLEDELYLEFLSETVAEEWNTPEDEEAYKDL